MCIVALAPAGPFHAPMFDELARFAGANAALAAPACPEALCETVSHLVPSHIPPAMANHATDAPIAR